MDRSTSRGSRHESSHGLSDIPQAKSHVPRRRSKLARHDQEAHVPTEDQSTLGARRSRLREGHLGSRSSPPLIHPPFHDNQIQGDSDPYPPHFGLSMHYPFGTGPMGTPPSSPVAQATADLRLFSQNLERLTNDDGQRFDGSVEQMGEQSASFVTEGEGDNRSFSQKLEQIPDDHCYVLRRFVHEQVVDPDDASYPCPWEYHGHYCRSEIKSFNSSNMFDADAEIQEAEARSSQDLALVGSFQEDFVWFQDVPDSMDLDDDVDPDNKAEHLDSGH